MRKVRIRRARLSDLSQILAIEREAFSFPWSKEAFLKEFEKKETVFLVAEKEDKLLGYICFWLIAGEMQLAKLAVKKDARRRGLGKRLLELSLKMARRYGAQEAWLEVREGNLAAIELYRSLGFQVEGRRPRYYPDTREDALLMGLTLT